MTYKYQNEIEDAVDVIYEVMGEEKHGKAQQELAEVYRKAEAFDDIKNMYDHEDAVIDVDDYTNLEMAIRNILERNLSGDSQ